MVNCPKCGKRMSDGAVAVDIWICWNRECPNYYQFIKIDKSIIAKQYVKNSKETSNKKLPRLEDFPINLKKKNKRKVIITHALNNQIPIEEPAKEKDWFRD